jgi:mannosyl-oligosaccharide glucosidase
VQNNAGFIQFAYLAVAVLVLGLGLFYKFYGSALLKPRSDDLKFLRAPKMLELSELIDSEYKNSMLWGSYRSGLYFGMRTR